jgi:tetratricopeptide (TPR) repeat protein
VKARQVFVRLAGTSLLLIGATTVDAQSTANTQRPLRPGQNKGPTFMVPVFRSAERGLGVQVADAVRDRLMNDNLMTSMWVVSKKDLGANLQLSGYSDTEALSEGDLKQLAVFIRAEEYIDGTLTKGADGQITLVATLNLPRGEGMVQPLGTFTGAKPGEIAAKLSPEIDKARKQIPATTACMTANRQREHDAAKAHAAKAIRDYPNSVFGRICLLEVAIAQKAADPELIRITEEILAIAPENDRALAVVTDAYARMVQTDKATYEAKYIAMLEKLLKADPTNTTMQAKVVRAMCAANQCDKGKIIIDEAVKQSPGDPELIKLQWQVYRSTNDTKGAIAIGEEMIKHDTAAADTLYFQQLVAAYLSDSQPVKAQEAAARGAAKFPNNATMWISVAQLARRNGQIPQALEAINKVAVINPKFPGLMLQKAAIYSEQDNLDSLRVTLRAAVDAGEDKATAAGMLLPKANNLLQAYQKDSAKTVEGGERILALFAFADSLNPTPTSGFLQAATMVVMGQPLLVRAQANKSCEDSKRMNDMLINAQQLIGKHGREFAASAGQLMQGAMQLQGYADQYVKAFCRANTGRPPKR